MKRRHLAAAALLFTACGAKPPPTAHTGPPASEPEVLAQRVVRDDKPAFPTTTAVVVPATVAPPVPVTLAEVVPLTVAEPVRAVGDCGGWEGVIAAHFGAEAAKACDVIRCETGGTFDPTIENPTSTASGLAQFLDSTWVRARALVGAEQYARASHAPGEVQIAAMAAWKRATSWSQWVCA